MTDILIIAATEQEVIPLLNKLNTEKVSDKVYVSEINSISVKTVISDMGTLFTSYTLTKEIVTGNPDLIINMGIAGSFNNDISIGDVVKVCTEEIGDLGYENKDSYVPFMRSGFMNPDSLPFRQGKIFNNTVVNSDTYKNLRDVSGITVNTAHGNRESINRFRSVYNADTESMEGAAVAYVSEMENIDYILIRSISNYVESRDKNRWNIPLAIKNLCTTTYNILLEISEQ
ncbi:MAG: futalosine hydrolase [Bacteroidales bacterium]|jgi:futalosine hydrolase|nr:futalosine hydrolase [Bacteroidales bacterium]